jgi:hypothetical protein
MVVDRVTMVVSTAELLPKFMSTRHFLLRPAWAQDALDTHYNNPQQLLGVLLGDNIYGHFSMSRN